MSLFQFQEVFSHLKNPATFDVSTIASDWRAGTLRTTARAVRVLPRARHFIFRNVHRLVGSPPHFVGEYRGEPFCLEFSDTDISLAIILWESFEPEVTALVAATVRSSPGTFVDVGANKGYFAVVVSAATAGKMPSVLYEINPVNIMDLEGTKLHGKHDNWTIRPVAASSSHGEVRLSIPEDAPNSGWARVTPDGEHVFPSVPLDEDLEQFGVGEITLMKIDVEGHEGEVLKGLSATVRPERVRNLFVEYHPSVMKRDGILESIADLESRGYHPYLLAPELRTHIDRDRENLLKHPLADLRRHLIPFAPNLPNYGPPFEVFFFPE